MLGGRTLVYHSEWETSGRVLGCSLWLADTERGSIVWPRPVLDCSSRDLIDMRERESQEPRLEEQRLSPAATCHRRVDKQPPWAPGGHDIGVCKHSLQRSINASPRGGAQLAQSNVLCAHTHRRHNAWQHEHMTQQYTTRRTHSPFSRQHMTPNAALSTTPRHDASCKPVARCP